MALSDSEVSKSETESKRLARRKQWWNQHKKQVQANQEDADDGTTAENTKKKAKLQKSESKKKKTENSKATSNPWKAAIEKNSAKTVELTKKVESDTNNASKKPKKRKTGAESEGKKTSFSDEFPVKPLGVSDEPIKQETIKQKSKKERLKYVLFVGNLPYNVTKEDLEEHFIRTGGVVAIRIPTEKITGKPRGFAYIEFQDKKSHTHALRLHHTEIKGRQINVEFTSIGGKSKHRLLKLKQKNKALERFKQFPGTLSSGGDADGAID